jgi:hypothetical protein
MREPTLSAYPYSTIELACRYCDRRGRYRRDRVILKHGGGMTLDQFVRMVSADCGFSEVRTGRKRCTGPYVVPPETRAPEVPRHCPLIKEKKFF